MLHPSVPPDHPAHRWIPPQLLLLALLLQGGLHLLPQLQLLAGWPRALGVAPLLGGIAIMSWAAALFGRHGTAIRPLMPSSALVLEGPYRFSRNPMYLGMLGVLVGVACLLGTALPWLVPPVFVALLTRVFIAPEERLLREQFGDAYETYAARVRRWL